MRNGLSADRLHPIVGGEAPAGGLVMAFLVFLVARAFCVANYGLSVLSGGTWRLRDLPAQRELATDRGQPNSRSIRSYVFQSGQRFAGLELPVLRDAHAETPRGLARPTTRPPGDPA